MKKKISKYKNPLKKSWVFLVVISVCISVGVLGYGLSTRASGTERYVAVTGADTTDCSISDTPCLTIQYAIDQANSGDTVNVATGNYDGDLWIHKSLTLQGAGYDTTTIRGIPGGSTLPTCTIDAGGATPIVIDGFTITQTITNPDPANNANSVGVLFQGIAAATLTNCRIQNHYTGVFLSSISNGTIEHNIIKDNGNGVLMQGCESAGCTPASRFDNTMIRYNNFTGNGLGTSSSRSAVRITGPILGTGPLVNHNSFVGNVNINSGSAGAFHNMGEHFGTATNIDSKNNWWGSSTGPTHTSNPSGVGDKVSNNVTFTPYYIDAEMTILSDTAPSVVYIDSAYSDGNSGGHAFGYDAFTTIQAGVTAVAINGTVNVAAGEYDEQIYITKALTIDGVGTTTIIKPSSLTTKVTTRAAQGSTVATGAIIVNNAGGNVVIKDLKVDASSLPADRTTWFTPTTALMRFAGVFYYNTSGTIDGVTSTNTNHIIIATTGASTWGRQVHAFWVDADATSVTSVEIKNSTASNYLSEGIKVASVVPTNITANIHNNTIIGDGSLTTRRQNGIQVYDGTTATAISYNTISNLVYRPGMNWATGITVVNVQPGAIIEHNTITNSDFGITDTFSSGVTIQHNGITGSGHMYGTGIYIDNGMANLTGIVVHANTVGNGFPYGGICLRGWYAGSNTISEVITDNILTGNGVSDGYGIFDDSGAPGSVTASITGNTISGWDSGIFFAVDDPVSGYTVNNNSISGNISYGVKNSTTGMLTATNIWWGSADLATIQSGILGDVSFEPYYIDAEMTTLSDAKVITAFTVPSQVGTTAIDEGTHTIDLTMPYGADVTALIPTITIAGASVSPTSSVANDFTIPQTYTVTAVDSSTRDYTVTVSFALNPAKAITGFTIPDQVGITTINESEKTVTLNIPFGTDVTALIPTITIIGASVSPASSIANDFTVPQTYTVTAADSSFQDYIITVNVLLEIQVTPDEDGNATVSSETPQVVITDPDQEVVVTIGSGISNPTVNVSSFITGGMGDIPQITIDSGVADIVIPAGTITSADPAWNGVIAAPTVTIVDIPATPGQTKVFSTAIELGFVGAKLSFEKAVRVLLPGQVGKRAGYVRMGIDFTEITNTCVSLDDQVAIDNDLVGFKEDCKKDAGSDLVVWTKHFTKFATYTQTTNPPPAFSGTVFAPPLAPVVPPAPTPAPVPTPVLEPGIVLYPEPTPVPPVVAKVVIMVPPTSVIKVPPAPPAEVPAIPIIEPVVKAVTKLFDIILGIQSALLNKSSSLIAVTQFTSFGTVPTTVDLNYKIIDSNNKEVYNEKDKVTVETERVVTREFQNLDVVDGKYTLLLTTTYGDNVIDDFRQDFEVRGATVLKYKVWVWILTILVVLGIAGLVFYKMNKRKKNNRSIKHKNKK